MNKISEVFNFINLIIGGIASFCIKLLGGGDNLLQFLLILFITEYFTSLYLSWKKIRQMNKKERFFLVIQKILMLWIIVVGVFLDNAFAISGQTLNARNMIISCFIGYEGLTIIENYDIMGIKLPEQFRQFFLKLINKNKGGDE